MTAITTAHIFVLKLHPETHQGPLDIDFDLEGIILIVEVKIAVAGKKLGGGFLYLEVVTEQSDALPGFIDIAHVKAAVIATGTEAPAIIESYQGIQADNGRVELDGLAYSQAVIEYTGVDFYFYRLVAGEPPHKRRRRRTTAVCIAADFKLLRAL